MGHAEVPGILRTRVDARNAKVNQSVTGSPAHGKAPMTSYVPIVTKLAQAQLEGEPIYTYDEGRAGSRAYQQVLGARDAPRLPRRHRGAPRPQGRGRYGALIRAGVGSPSSAVAPPQGSRPWGRVRPHHPRPRELQTRITHDKCPGEPIDHVRATIRVRATICLEASTAVVSPRVP